MNEGELDDAPFMHALECGPCPAPWPSLMAAVDQCRWLQRQGWTVKLASVVAPGERRRMPDGTRLLAEVYDPVMGTPGWITYLDATDTL